MTKKALMTYGGWDGHAPKECTEIFKAVLEGEGFEVELHDNLDCFLDQDNLMSKDLIVPCWTMSQISGEQMGPLKEAIKSGVGFSGWHGGAGDAFRNACDWQFLVGGQFVGHPGNIMPYTVNITAKNDPIVEGLSDFNMESELYYMHVDPSNEVLATATFTDEHCDWIGGTVMPIMWKRPYGKGRVFYSSLGHQPSDFDVPEAKETLRRGMLWASK